MKRIAMEEGMSEEDIQVFELGELLFCLIFNSDFSLIMMVPM